jgi:hypothetical protein
LFILASIANVAKKNYQFTGIVAKVNKREKQCMHLVKIKASAEEQV